MATKQNLNKKDPSAAAVSVMNNGQPPTPVAFYDTKGRPKTELTRDETLEIKGRIYDLSEEINELGRQQQILIARIQQLKGLLAAPSADNKSEEES